MANANPSPHLSRRRDLIPVGQPAPRFEATDQAGRLVRLGDLLPLGPVVLIFYPMDNTPVCTRQLCAVRDDWARFQQRGVTVVGINPRKRRSHAAFASKHALPFPVVVDDGSRIAAAYGAAGLLVTRRTVYVLDSDGTVRLAERGVVPHETIFSALNAHSGGS